MYLEKLKKQSKTHNSQKPPQLQSLTIEDCPGFVPNCYTPKKITAHSFTNLTPRLIRVGILWFCVCVRLSSKKLEK